VAIEIKRTPSLSGQAAEDFLKTSKNVSTKESKESIAAILSKTQKILSNYKAGK